MFELFKQYCLTGLAVGSIYAIIALGFNIIYNTTGIINFAQGEFLVIGAMTAIALNAVLPLPLAIVCAVLITLIVGGVLEIAFIKWLVNPSVLRLIIITIGISILLREAMLHIWGNKFKSLPFFSGSGGTSLKILGAAISPQYLWVLGASVVTVAALALFFKFTLLGRAMRACADNPTASQLCGINTKWLVTLSFMLSAGIGALAGCVMSPIIKPAYDDGTSLAISGFTVAVLGGLGNSSGAVLTGLVIGVLQENSLFFLPNNFKDVFVLLLLLNALCLKPSGLFGNEKTSSLKEF